MRIQALPIYLANQIAAGEVVERPANVLKEFLENSVDAKSQQINITIEKGGMGLIKVQDNGEGIYKEDLLLAVAPHATSKISSLQDLEGVLSFGFRGEALASISSVSHLTVASRSAMSDTAWKVMASGRGANPHIMPVAHPQGTTIEMRELFYNTPARRKFLRSQKTELHYVEEVFKKIALSKFDIAFSFTNHGKKVWQLNICNSQASKLQRISQLCGQSFAAQALYVEAESNGLKLYGWMGQKNYTRAQNDLQYFYVNGRVVRDKVVNHAIRLAYQDLCVPGRHAAYILYFELSPHEVDVNVHPTKHEVRFREARSVHAFIASTIQSAFSSTQNLPEPIPTIAMSDNSQTFAAALLKEPIHIEANRTAAAVIEYSSSLPVQEFTRHTPDTIQALQPLNTIPDSALPIEKSNSALNVKPTADKPKILCIIKNQLILCETFQGCLLIDVAKAITMLALADLRQELEKGDAVSVILAKPWIIDLKNNIDIEHMQEYLLHFGFDIRQLAIKSYSINAVPKSLYQWISKEKFVIQLPVLFALLTKKFTQEKIENCLLEMIEQSTCISLPEAQLLIDKLVANDNDAMQNIKNNYSKTLSMAEMLGWI